MRLLVYPQINPKVTEKLISNDDIYCLCNNLRYLYECNLIACGSFFTPIIPFHARLLTDQKNIKDKAVVVFADVTLNTGNAYSATTGDLPPMSRDTSSLLGPFLQPRERWLAHSSSSMVILSATIT